MSMEISKWEEFLSDNELNAHLYLAPNGKYLFGKILHDVLECLTMYLGCLEVIPELAENGEEISQDISNWLNLRVLMVESLISEITPLWQYEKELLVESFEWPHLIKRVGLIVARGFPSLLDGYDKLDMTVQSDSHLLVETAINNLRRLQLIWIDIKNEEYKRLWTTRKYGVS